MNASVRSSLFGGAAVFNWTLDSVIFENLRPYATTIPDFKPKGRNPLTRLPRMPDSGRELPYVRAAQVKQAHRERMIQEAVDPTHKWPLNAALQTYQGGFMAKAVSTRLADRDRLQKSNPIVYCHGTSDIGGMLNFSHIMPIGDPHIINIPVIRTDSTEQQVYHLQDEQQLADWEEERRLRQPYSKAERSRDLEWLASYLRQEGRDADAKEVEAVIADPKKLTDKEKVKFLKEKLRQYAQRLEKKGFANVELRQALLGYEAVSVNTQWHHNIQGWNLPDSIAGLMLLGFDRWSPVLGGRTAVGCGFYPRWVYRVAIGTSRQHPAFDCLLKYEPFKGLAICLDDHTGASDNWASVVDGKEWHAISANGSLPDCHVSKAITAWRQCDKKKFDFNFVPRAGLSDEDEAEVEVEVEV